MRTALAATVLALAALWPALPAGVASASEAAARPAVPSKQQVRSAQRWLRTRQGVTSFALTDSRGRLRGFAPRRRYVSASVVKAMLLVAYLRRIGNRRPGPGERALLGPMIRISSNANATAMFGRVGAAGLYRLARRADLRDFQVPGDWASAVITAADQARFFSRFDRLTPPRSRRYARRLLASVDESQRWGFPTAALRGGFRAFFKLGWRSTSRGQLVHAAGLFERRALRVSLAVLTDGNPSHTYGTATIRGVTRRIFRRPPTARPAQAGSPAHRRAGLLDIHEYGPGIALDLAYAGPDNLTGRRLPGYCRPWALLLRRSARDLGRVQRHLRPRGLGLLVLDAYRPARASRALVRWAIRSGRPDLVGTYIARRSRHNTGSAVDLTLVRLSDGRRLPMGRYDALGPGAHTLDATGRVLRNRLTLRRAMNRFGFEDYWREWWHFEHRERGAAYLDLPLGCGTR